MVTARMSRCSASIMRSVARSSSDSQIGIKSRASYAVERVTTSSCIIIACRPIACTSASMAALKSANGTSRRGGVDDDDHREVVADQRLRDVEDVAAELGDARGDARDDALGVAAGGRQHGAVARARALLLEAGLAVVDAGADLDRATTTASPLPMADITSATTASSTSGWRRPCAPPPGAPPGAPASARRRRRCCAR